MNPLARSPDSDGVPLAITAQDLTRIYDVGSVRVTGIESIDLSIPTGKLVVLKGDSGSGKSTLLSLLAGLDLLTSGHLIVAGRDLTQSNEFDLTDFRRYAVGIIFQSFNLLPTLNVFENVCLPAMLAGASMTDARARAVELLNNLGMAHRLEHRPRELSGGEMQRTAIARSLINNPGILLADEPTGNLDSQNARKVMALLADQSRQFGRTVIIATHSDLADDHAAIMLTLRDGRLVA